MMTSHPLGLAGVSGPTLIQLDARARDIFRRVVETYLETGEPVGSRTVSRGVQLSPASIRNTMQDLTQLGLLAAPHTSAGRFPTHAGLRLFVDGLMELGEIGQDERLEIEGRMAARGRGGLEEALDEATSLLSALAGGAGVVVTPARDAGVKHVEFVALGADQALVVMVFDDGSIENRLMQRPAGLTPSALQEASNFLNAVMNGRTLAEAKTEVGADLERARRELNAATARLVEDGLAGWGGGEGLDRSLIVRGRGNLLDGAAAEDLERVRMLFDDLEQKEQLIGLLDNVRDAQGVSIFIGAETRLFSLSGSAVIAAPYMTERRKVLGAIGVIGPTRLNYARVIPLVDYTARMLGRLLDV